MFTQKILAYLNAKFAIKSRAPQIYNVHMYNAKNVIFRGYTLELFSVSTVLNVFGICMTPLVC